MNGVQTQHFLTIDEQQKKKKQQDAAAADDGKVKSYAAGTEHLVETTTGDAALDAKVALLGQRIEERFDRTITHIVAVTCTGILVPGAEYHIMKAFNLPQTTQRLPITFAGCFGMVSGVRTASALAMENPKHRVLVVCTELCSLHMQLNDNIDNLIASALFADGSGAFIVGCAPTPKENPILSIDSLSSCIIPNTVQQMAWEQSRSGMIIGLAKEIAGEIFKTIGGVVADMLTYVPDPKHPNHRITAKDCNLALHPGGPLILNSIQKVLGLPEITSGSALEYKNSNGVTFVDYSHPCSEAWKVLNEYGNLSSATLVFVLDRLRENPEKFSKFTPTLAFGPGLSIEATLLYLLPGKDNYNLNKALKHQQRAQQQKTEPQFPQYQVSFKSHKSDEKKH